MIKLAGYGFVDDVDLIQTWNDEEKVIQKAEEGLQIWEGTLRATGGALSTEKSFWYGIAFEFKNDTWIYKNENSLKGTITSKNHDNIRTKIERMNCSKEKETLGVFLAPDASQDKEIEKLSIAAKVFADSIQIGRISKKDALQAIRSTIWKTLEYPMAVTSLTKKIIL